MSAVVICQHTDAACSRGCGFNACKRDGQLAGDKPKMTNQSDAERLRPCPFCGGEAETDNTYECGTYYGCNRCVVWMLGEAKWNTRTPASQDRALLQQALDALKVSSAQAWDHGQMINNAITTLRAALAQPADTPFFEGLIESRRKAYALDQSCTPEFLHWIDTQARREGVGANEAWNAGYACAVNKAQPAQPAAVQPLTDEQIAKISYFSGDVRGVRVDQFKFARAIEAAIKPKASHDQ